MYSQLRKDTIDQMGYGLYGGKCWIGVEVWVSLGVDVGVGFGVGCA